MSTMLSKNEEVDKNTKTEHMNTVIQEANEISQDLYNVKVKLKDIQFKTQYDIHNSKLYTDLKNLEELKVKKEDATEKTLNAFNDLKLELKEVASVIAELRKLSDPKDKSNSTELNKQQTRRKLQALTSSLFCKSVNVKWNFALLKTELTNEKTKREFVASLLIKHLQKETLVPPISAPKDEHGSTKQTMSLADAISGLNNLFGKPSFPFSDEIPTSKQQNSDKKQQPIFKPDVPGPTKTPEALGSFKFEPSISSPLQFKTGSSYNETSKLQANGPPNLSGAAPTSGSTKQTMSLADAISELNNLFGKPSFPFSDEIPISKQQNSDKKQQPIFKPDVPGPTKTPEPLGSFKFEPSISNPLQFKTESSYNETSKLQANGPSNLPGAAPTSGVQGPSKTFEEFGAFKRFFNWSGYWQLFKQLPISRPSQSNTESTPLIGATPTISGTTSVKCRPLIDVIRVDIDGLPKNMTQFYRCITMLKEYEHKSLEELRLEDYFIQQKNNNFVHGNSFTKDFKKLNAIHVKFEPTNDTEMTCEENEKVDQFQSITLMKEFENQSFEELRLSDYNVARVFTPEVFSPNFKKLNAIHVKFEPTNDTEMTCEENEKVDQFQSITLMKEFENQSFEELRLSDYNVARVFTPEVFSPNGMGTARVMFFPPIDIENYVKPNGIVEDVNVTYHYITALKEFEKKSLEELRFEDYIADRRGPTQSVFELQQKNSNLQKCALDATGTARVKFIATTDTDVIVKAGTSQNINIKYQYITAMKEYENKSLEELRFEDYIAGRKPVGNVSKSESSTNKTQSPGKSKNPSESRESKQYDQAQTKRTDAPKQDDRLSFKQFWETLMPTLKPSHVAADVERLLEDGETEKAIKKSSDALELEPENVCFLMYRARAYYELKQYREALDDAQKADSLLPNLPAIGYLTIAKCCLALGQVAPGEQAIRRAIERDPSVEVKELRDAFECLRTKQQSAQRCISQHSYHDAVQIINYCLKNHCPASSMMKVLKAECLAHMRKYEEARSIAIDLSRLSTNAQSRDAAVYSDAIYVTGLCSYYQENDELATKYFRKVLENDPDHEKAIKMFKLTKTRMNTKLIKQKKELGNKAFNEGEWTKALKFYDEALSIDKNNKEENAKLHYNRATVFAKQNQLRKSIDACTAALELDGNYIKALLNRAQCYKKIEMYEESFDDYEKLYCINSTEENKRLRDEANSAYIANRGPYYYYKVLGIDRTATQSDIRKAYLKYVLLYHPDKQNQKQKTSETNASLAEVSEVKTNRMFLLVQEAYNILFDSKSRAIYDRNQRNYRK